MAFNLLELTDSGAGLLNTAISPEDGSAEATFRLNGVNEATPPTVSQISEVFDYFCGGVRNLTPKVVNPQSDGGGKISRILPPVHPFRPELSSAGVTSMSGIGDQHTGTAVQVNGLDPVKTLFAHWTAYDYRVKFTKRPYFLMPDEKIQVRSGMTYYPPDGAGGLLFYHADEWRRFTKMTVSPLPDTVTATDPAGMMTFRTQTGTSPGGTPGHQFNGSPYVSLQNSMVEIEWFNIPMRYFQDHTVGGVLYRSYLNRFIGTVNQYDITICGRLFERGSLLYLGTSPTSYIPSSPQIQRFINALALGLDQSMMANAKMRFIHTGRQGTDVPNAGHAILADLNRIPAGHNLQPHYAKRQKFYYVTDPTDRPCHDSFPVQLFFTDPMLSQPAGVI